MISPIAKHDLKLVKKWWILENRAGEEWGWCQTTEKTTTTKRSYRTGQAYLALVECLAPTNRQSFKNVTCPFKIMFNPGSGKSTVMKLLMSEFGDYFGFSVRYVPGSNPQICS